MPKGSQHIGQIGKGKSRYDFELDPWVFIGEIDVIGRTMFKWCDYNDLIYILEPQVHFAHVRAVGEVTPFVVFMQDVGDDYEAHSRDL